MTATPAYLAEILAARTVRSRPAPPASAPARPGFAAALRRAAPRAIIAEVKVASPSRGSLLGDRSPAELATAYARAGAAAISVVTEERYFLGSLELLLEVRRAVELPILRKDFLTEPADVDESAAFGASAVLLIARILEPRAFAALLERARQVGIDALVELHDEADADRAREAGADLCGVNCRDLDSFAVDLGVAERLAPRLPATALRVTESGIRGPADVTRLAAAGYDAFLVGEALLRAPDPGRLLMALREAS